jgi:thiamine biosynthesis lipoprotein
MRQSRWLLWSALLLWLGQINPVTADWFSQSADIMGTRIRVEVWHPEQNLAEQAIAAVLEEFHRIDRLMSPFREESELSLLNREADRRPIPISKELFQLLQTSREISELTAGAFDITFASIGHYYDYRRGIAPSDEALRENLSGIGYRHVTLDPSRQAVNFTRPQVRIDLGGIAKGYAVDRGIELLRREGIESALITAGGDSRMLGDRQGRPWRIGIRAPRDPEGVVAILPLLDSAVSTSGDYERYFETDGVRHHHIISPSTGHSAREVQSVTIIGPNATRTDALSTSIFVLGSEAGLELINRLPEMEAVIIDNTGRMLFSSGLEDIQAGP